MSAPLELYRQFFEHGPIGCGISDARGRLIDFNQAMLEYSGWSREEIEAMGSVTALYYDGEAERDRLLKIAAENGRLERQEVRFKKKDGTWFWGAMSLIPIMHEGERYWLAVVENVTERRRAVAERERQMRELEQMTRMLVDRENKMIELKRKIEALTARAGAKERR